jgi:hypothetical protein
MKDFQGFLHVFARPRPGGEFGKRYGAYGQFILRASVTARVFIAPMTPALLHPRCAIPCEPA